MRLTFEIAEKLPLGTVLTHYNGGKFYFQGTGVPGNKKLVIAKSVNAISGGSWWPPESFYIDIFSAAESVCQS